jgi:hypothetical protein
VALGAAILAVAAPPAAAEFRLTVPLDRSGAAPGSLTLTIHRDSKPRRSDAVTLVLPESPGAAARDPYATVQIPSRLADAFSEESGGSLSRAAALPLLP